MALVAAGLSGCSVGPTARDVVATSIAYAGDTLYFVRTDAYDGPTRLWRMRPDGTPVRLAPLTWNRHGCTGARLALDDLGTAPEGHLTAVAYCRYRAAMEYVDIDPGGTAPRATVLAELPPGDRLPSVAWHDGHGWRTGTVHGCATIVPVPGTGALTGCSETAGFPAVDPVTGVLYFATAGTAPTVGTAAMSGTGGTGWSIRRFDPRPGELVTIASGFTDLRALTVTGTHELLIAADRSGVPALWRVPVTGGSVRESIRGTFTGIAAAVDGTRVSALLAPRGDVDGDTFITRVAP